MKNIKIIKRFNKRMYDDDSWEVKIDMIKNCDKSPSFIKVKINPIVKSKIDYLMNKFKNIEWLAYLIGNDNIIEDLFIPDQTVSASSVNNITCKEYNDKNVVGVIHSHHNMRNDFSSTDDEWINQNHNISLCVSKSGIKGHVRFKTPCGALKIVDAKVVLNINSNFNKKEFEKEINKKIKKIDYNLNNYRNNYHFSDNPLLKTSDNPLLKTIDDDLFDDNLVDDIIKDL